MIALGIGIGFIIGALMTGWSGGIAGALVGFVVTLAWRSRAQARERGAARAQVRAATYASAPAGTTTRGDASDIAQRLAAIEHRLAALERNAGWAVAPVASDLAVPVIPTGPLSTNDSAAFGSAAAALRAGLPTSPPEASSRPDLMGAEPESASVAGAVRTAGFMREPDGTLAPPPGARPVASDAVAASTAVPVAVATSANPLWAWFTGANTLTRIGVVVLFFGVAFLLKYFAELVTIPIAVKLSGVAVVGAVLIGFGARLARTRPGYGLSLEGAGAGILYLTTFAAFRLYDVLPALPAFAALVAIAALTVFLAVRADSQPLAGLAIAGGFLAPFLVATSAGEPVMLFGYFAVLNAAIFAIAWVRAWRGLNVIGFVFTFVLGVYWGERYYRPGHFQAVEPFLALFFLFYVAIAILYAKRDALHPKAPVDALLVFGVPLVAFVLQANLVYDTEYGVAWSAIFAAAVYGVLALALLRRPEPGLALLARAFVVLAIIFATVAIPFAADPRWTTAWWALEGAGVYWIGCRQRQVVARALALVVQGGAAVMFVVHGLDGGGRLFLNATFLGTSVIAIAALVTAFLADRYRDSLVASERVLSPLMVLWGVCWWYGGGALEIDRALPGREVANAFLAYATGSVALALPLRRLLRWPRLAWFGAALLPVMALVAISDWDRMRTTLQAYGVIVWPLAWLTHWWFLRAADDLRAADETAAAARLRVTGVLARVHVASAIALVAWVGWEGSEWVGRTFPAGTVWMACAAAWPAIAYLAAATRRIEYRGWPFAEYHDAYAVSAATTIAALLAVWFAIVNIISPGGTMPLPFVPLANALDLTLIAALAALLAWARFRLRLPERALYAWFGAALFLLVNAIVFRTIHQWLDVPWRLHSLLASKPLQAALTLTWTATALPLMVLANRRLIRPLWMVGAGLLAIVVVKLFVVDLGALSGLPRVVAFLGVGLLLLVIGYVAPLPTSAGDAGETQR